MSVCGPRSVPRQILSTWKTLVIILTPILFSPLPIIIPTSATRCAYVILIMAVYWMTEAIPMAATALMPVAVMPWLGIMATKDICMNYLKDTNMLFLGGLLMAVAVEKWNLHKRIALGVLLFVGSRPKWLLFGFMITTGFLSMWLSNTATTAMMIPIANAVLTELDKHRRSKRYAKAQSENYHKLSVPANGPSTHNSSITLETSLDTIDSCHLDTPRQGAKSLGSNSPVTPPEEVKIVVLPNSPPSYDMATNDLADPCAVDLAPEDLTDEHRKEDEAFSLMSKGLMLCVAYAANIGGTATLTGTGPNLILKGQVDTLYGSGAGLNFSSWFVLAFPNMLLTMVLAWLWLQALFLGPRELFSCLVKDKGPQDKTANAVIRREYTRLGPWSFAEISTLILFILLALLWLFREPEFMPGWSSFFIDGYVSDACVAVAIGLLLFMLPSTPPNILCFRNKYDTSEPGPVPSLLDWETVHKKLPWNVIIVLGGGFALADACKQSGLSVIIGDAFSAFQGIPTWSLVLALCIITAAFTEVASNTATATIFLPILAELAVAMQVHPLYLMMPVTIATSLAFMLPVATPPNAMVFAYGTLKIVDMAKAGIMMNILSILSLTVAINTWGYAYFDLGVFPDWAQDGTLKNVTTTVAAALAGDGNLQL